MVQITKKYKNTILLVIGLMLIFGGVRLTKQQTKSDRQPNIVKIGLIAPFTGEFADKGKELKDGSLFALHHINKNSKYKYELIAEDNRFLARDTITVYNKLVHQDKVSAIISMWSTTGLAVAPLAQKDKIVHFAVDNSSKIADLDYSHIISAMPDTHTSLSVSKMKKDGVNNIAVVIQNDTWGNNMLNSLSKEAKKENIKISSILRFNLNQRDFRIPINKMMEDKPQMIVLVIDPPALEIFTKQLRELGYKIPLTSFETFGYTQYKDLYEGDWYTDAKDPTDDMVKDFRHKYNKDFTATSAHAYNAILILSKAIDKLDNITADNIEESLKTVKSIEGATGRLEIPDSKIIAEPTIFKVIKDGQTSLLKE